jgi:hypothetical protein
MVEWTAVAQGGIMCETTRKPRSIRSIDPKKGLHGIKREIQKRFMAEQCEQLVAVFDEAISATFAAAPDRRRPYLIDRTKVSDPKQGLEAHLERSLHAQWSRADCAPATGCWERIVAFQVNLPAKRDSEGWGEIDLLGVAEDGLPIVIELKRGKSKEPPAALLVQAAAYAIALQRAWWFLREEWLRRVQPSKPIPTALLPCRLVCAAPEEYWQQWQLTPREDKALTSLREAFASRGLPSVFASVGATAAGDHSASAV